MRDALGPKVSAGSDLRLPVAPGGATHRLLGAPCWLEASRRNAVGCSRARQRKHAESCLAQESRTCRAMSSATILAATCCQPTSVIQPYIVRDYRFSLPAFSRKGGSFDCHTNFFERCDKRALHECVNVISVHFLYNSQSAQQCCGTARQYCSPVFCCATVDCRW